MLVISMLNVIDCLMGVIIEHIKQLAINVIIVTDQADCISFDIMDIVMF